MYTVKGIDIWVITIISSHDLVSCRFLLPMADSDSIQYNHKLECLISGK